MGPDTWTRADVLNAIKAGRAEMEWVLGAVGSDRIVKPVVDEAWATRRSSQNATRSPFSLLPGGG